MHKNRVVVTLKKVFDYPKAMLDKSMLFDDARNKAIADFKEEINTYKETVADNLDIHVEIPERFVPESRLEVREGGDRSRRTVSKDSIRRSFIVQKSLEKYGVASVSHETHPDLFEMDDDDEYYAIGQLESDLDEWNSFISNVLDRI